MDDDRHRHRGETEQEEWIQEGHFSLWEVGCREASYFLNAVAEDDGVVLPLPSTGREFPETNRALNP